jgi:putative methyltransferase (TIGR04325 family)
LDDESGGRHSSCRPPAKCGARSKHRSSHQTAASEARTFIDAVGHSGPGQQGTDGKPLRIVDFDGAAEVDFANQLAAISDTSNIRYHVVDFAKVCAVGRTRWEGDARISSQDALPESAEFDLVYGWSSIHCVADPLRSLTQFTTYSPRAILIAESPFTSGKAFVRAQVNRLLPFPQWVLSLADVEHRMNECGYRLAYHVAGRDDYNVDNYPPAYRLPNSASLLFLGSH